MLRRDASIEPARPVTRVEEVWAIADLPSDRTMSDADLASAARLPLAAKTREAIVCLAEYTTRRLYFFSTTAGLRAERGQL
jgi:hypothetical protein